MPPLTLLCYRDVDDYPRPMLRLRHSAFNNRLERPNAATNEDEFAVGSPLYPAFLLQAGGCLQECVRVRSPMVPAVLRAGIPAGPSESVVASTACRQHSHGYSSTETGWRITVADWQPPNPLGKRAEWLLRPVLSREMLA